MKTMKYKKNITQFFLYIAVMCLCFSISAHAQSPYHGGKGDGYASAEIHNIVLSINPSLSQTQLVNLYPNPAKTSENLQVIIASKEAYKIKIINLLGQVIFSQDYNGEKSNIQLSGFAAGSYVVCIHNGNYNYIQKLVIVSQ